MAKCLHHMQEFSPTQGEFCAYCGNPDELCLHLKQVSAILGICEKTARKWFEREPGVLMVHENSYNPRRESRVHFRVPRFVMKRVQAQRSIGE